MVLHQVKRRTTPSFVLDKENKMKRVYLVLIILLAFTIPCSAGWYVISLDTNRATSKTNYLPDANDLATRNEIAIFSEEDIPLKDAELMDGKIKVRAKSQAEKNEIADKKAEREDRALIQKKMKELAYDALVVENVKFKKLKKEDLK